MQFGMPTLIENTSLEQNLTLCRELGLNFIELNMNFPEYQLDTLENSSMLTDAGAASGVYFTIHLDENLNIADFNPLIAAAYLETVRRTIDICKKLIPLRDQFGDSSQPLTINMHMNHGIYITLPSQKVLMYERYFDFYMNSFFRFRKLCEEWIDGANLMLVIENTDGFRDFEKIAIEYLLQSEYFGLTWDIGHSKTVGEVDLPFLCAHQNKLRHFHIHDGSSSPAKNHLALGDGEINLLQRLTIANETRCRCVVEAKTIAALKQSVRWLHENLL